MKNLLSQTMFISVLFLSMIFSNVSAAEFTPSLKIVRYVSESGSNMRARIYLQNLPQDTISVQFDLQTPKTDQYKSMKWNDTLSWSHLQESNNNDNGQITFYIIGNDLSIEQDGNLYLGEMSFRSNKLELTTTGDLKYLQKNNDEITEITLQNVKLDITTKIVESNDSSNSNNNNNNDSSSNDSDNKTDEDTLDEKEEDKSEQNNTTIPEFTDIKDHWAKSSIEFIVSKGYMNGMDDNKFAPNDTMTRAMLVRTLYNTETKIEKAQPQSKSNGFIDVPKDAWFTSAVDWAANNNIVYGMGNNEFAPNKEVTREEMVTMLKRYADFKNLTLPEIQKTIQFSDANKISPWAIESVTAMQKASVVSGRGNNLFDPKTSSTRAEIASAFERFVKNVLQVEE